MKTFLSQHDLIWKKPPVEWVDGIPLANGDMGAMIWGDAAPINVSLDKYDTWELRSVTPDNPQYSYQGLRKLIAEGKGDEARRIFQTDLRKKGVPFPTRLPLPRLTVNFNKPVKEFFARLSLFDALVTGKIIFAEGNIRWKSFVHSEKNLFLLEIEKDKNIGFPTVEISTDFWEDQKGISIHAHWSASIREILKSWGYPAPVIEKSQNEISFYQEIPSGESYAVAVKIVRKSLLEQICLSVISSRDAVDPLACAKTIIKDASGSKTTVLIDGHRGFWNNFWGKSFLTIPDAKVENLFYAELYKLGCSSREGKLPCTLQGLWTKGDGGMPPWSGDYHLDMNIQETYWPVYTSNHLECGLPLYEHFWQTLPKFQKICKDFFGFQGAHARCEMGLYGAPLYGYYTTNFCPANGAWLAHHFWLHWLYSQNKKFLRERCYPFMRAFMQTYLNLAEKEADGKYHLPLSNSPEYGEDRPESWGKDTNGDLALMRWLASALLETTRLLKADDLDIPRWQDLLENLVDYPQGEDGLHLFAGQPIEHSHRHFTHLLMIHPLSTLNIEGTDKDRELIKKSIFQLCCKGTGEWAGHSFPEMSLIASRTGYNNMAWYMLQTFLYFIRPNTLHVNRDQQKTGVSSFWGNDHPPMTLEAGFCAAAALMEMLLQSWNGIIRVFPGIPEFWHNAGFRTLRTEGAFLVSSVLSEGKVQFVEIFSETGGICRVKNPFANQKIKLIAPDATSILTDKQIVEFKTRPGKKYRLVPKNSKLTKTSLPFPQFKRGPEEQNWFGCTSSVISGDRRRFFSL